MIKVESITMKEVLGSRELTLDFEHEKTIAISGPNGSGKSGVVDALEFCLTGEISRLQGTGTKGLTVQRHGPHVEFQNRPSSAEVTMCVRFLELGKTAVTSRNMSNAPKAKIYPDDQYARSRQCLTTVHILLTKRPQICFT